MYFRSIDKLNDFDQNSATSGSSIKSQALDLKTLPILSPLKKGARQIQTLVTTYVENENVVLTKGISR